MGNWKKGRASERWAGFERLRFEDRYDQRQQPVLIQRRKENGFKREEEQVRATWAEIGLNSTVVLNTNNWRRCFFGLGRAKNS